MTGSEPPGPRATDPGRPGARLPALDVLRGLAILGILVANMAVVSGYLFLDPVGRAALPAAAANPIADFLIRMLLEGKFYSIFSLLFGYGVALQMASADRQGEPFPPRFRRRLRGLALIGAAHALLLWAGDILLLYALLGFLLIPFLRSTDRALFRGAVVCLVLPVAVYLAMLLLMGGGGTSGGAESGNPFLTRINDGFRSPSWLEAFRANLILLAGRWADLFLSARFPKVFGMFLLGSWLGRRGFALRHQAESDLARRVAVWGLAVGLPFSATMAWLEGMEVFFPPSLAGLGQVVAATIGVPALALGYAATVALLLQRERWSRWLGTVAPAGRMALTNYLMHSVVMTALFYGWGLGWYGRVGTAITTLLAVGVWLVQLPLSRWWLARYRHGPVEWLWRRMTYASPLPWRR